MSKNVLFICGRNKKRSPTAEDLFVGHKGIIAQSAGINPEAEVVVDTDLIEWADVVYVMSKRQLSFVKATFQHLLNDKKVISLDIKDKYEYADPELIAILKKKLHRLL